MSEMDDTAPGQSRNAWLNTSGTKPFSGLHPIHAWEPYLHGGDGYKVVGYRRADAIGYVLPVVDSDLTLTGDWWVTWAHSMMCGRPGWHHHALGTYPSAQAAAFAFDTVYALEHAAGNRDRCPELKMRVS